MPANNTNTRTIKYIGDDPELRKFIHKWDSINFEYEENENEKILHPRCGYGYCIWRNVKDVIIKMPAHPYDGDCFAIMDITGGNIEYITENYYNNNKLPKEEVISDNLTLTEANIYIDNSYNFSCRTKVIYNDITYQAGESFLLEKTCCYVYVFLYAKDINAWVVKWVEKDCLTGGCPTCGSAPSPPTPDPDDVKIIFQMVTVVRISSYISHNVMLYPDELKRLFGIDFTWGSSYRVNHIMIKSIDNLDPERFYFDYNILKEDISYGKPGETHKITYDLERLKRFFREKEPAFNQIIEEFYGSDVGSTRRHIGEMATINGTSMGEHTLSFINDYDGREINVVYLGMDGIIAEDIIKDKGEQYDDLERIFYPKDNIIEFTIPSNCKTVLIVAQATYEFEYSS